MSPEEIEKFEKGVQYLKNNIAPDDIYMFAMQLNFMALFFLGKWSDWVDVPEEMSKCPTVHRSVINLATLAECQSRDINFKLDIGIE